MVEKDWERVAIPLINLCTPQRECFGNVCLNQHYSLWAYIQKANTIVAMFCNRRL